MDSKFVQIKRCQICHHKILQLDCYAICGKNNPSVTTYSQGNAISIHFTSKPANTFQLLSFADCQVFIIVKMEPSALKPSGMAGKAERIGHKKSQYLCDYKLILKLIFHNYPCNSCCYYNFYYPWCDVTIFSNNNVPYMMMILAYMVISITVLLFNSTGD